MKDIRADMEMFCPVLRPAYGPQLLDKVLHSGLMLLELLAEIVAYTAVVDVLAVAAASIGAAMCCIGRSLEVGRDGISQARRISEA